MSSIIDVKSNQDRTVEIFDSFYALDLVVNTNEYDVVLSYFKSVCKTTTIAQNFTAFLFRIAQETNISAMSLLENIQGFNKLDMNRTIAYYMNSLKSKTSLYGVSIIPSPNEPVARNIVQ